MRTYSIKDLNRTNPGVTVAKAREIAKYSKMLLEIIEANIANEENEDQIVAGKIYRKILGELGFLQ